MRVPTIAILLLLPAPALGQTPTCDRLEPDRQARASRLLESTYAYDCCDATLAQCLKAQPRCSLVVRLANEVCRRVEAGQEQTEIERALQRRAMSMTPAGPPAEIHVDMATRAGARDAPVVLVEYACARCPFCKVLTPALHHEVTSGRLYGKVQLFFRPFPIRSHPGSVEGGLAMVSAARLGHFWPFLLHLYAEFEAFCPDRLPAWAATEGADRQAFEALVADPRTREELVAAKKEGIRNGVDATPTLFINGRRYVHDMDTETMVDVLEEEHERITGTGGG